MHFDFIKKMSLSLLSCLLCLFAQASETHGSYFEQFKFSVYGSCENIYSMHFTSTSSIEFASLGPGENGGKKYATLGIQLFENGSYWGKYSEQDAGRLTYMEVLQGKWIVENETIILGNLGSGVPDQYQINEHKTVDSIRFRFSRVLNDPKILNSTMNMTQFMTNIGPKGKSAAQYCHGL